MATEKKIAYPDTKLVVGLIVGLFALVYLGAAWFPETVKIIFNVKQNESQFAGFGTIGDFFGGVINPILTFITIYLLLVSIRIQRDELEATREEMKEATKQAEISANAIVDSFNLERSAQWPLIRFHYPDSSQSFGYLSYYTKVDEGGLTGEIKAEFHLVNKGKSPCRLVSVEFLKEVSFREFLGFSDDSGLLKKEFENVSHIKVINLKFNNKELRKKDFILPGETVVIYDSEDKTQLPQDVEAYASVMAAKTGRSRLKIVCENLVGDKYTDVFEISCEIKEEDRQVVDHIVSYDLVKNINMTSEFHFVRSFERHDHRFDKTN